MAKIEALETATSEQLAAHGDVCAICYMEMSPTTAKITPCGHFYHGNCLRKWLFVQDHCPMCSKKICSTSEDEEINNDELVEEVIEVSDSDEGVSDDEDEDPRLD